MNEDGDCRGGDGEVDCEGGGSRGVAEEVGVVEGVFEVEDGLLDDMRESEVLEVFGVTEDVEVEEERAKLDVVEIGATVCGRGKIVVLDLVAAGVLMEDSGTSLLL